MFLWSLLELFCATDYYFYKLIDSPTIDCDKKLSFLLIRPWLIFEVDYLPRPVFLKFVVEEPTILKDLFEEFDTSIVFWAREFAVGIDERI